MGPSASSNDKQDLERPFCPFRHLRESEFAEGTKSGPVITLIMRAQEKVPSGKPRSQNPAVERITGERGDQ